jgi:hypothetical protein
MTTTKAQASEWVRQAIEHEREQQDKQWGGASHDDDHTASTWTQLILKHFGRLAGDQLAQGWGGDEHYDGADVYRRTIALAALVIAYAEWQRRLT